jgi:hypothetical protein
MELEQRLGTRSAFYFTARQGSLPEYALGTPEPFYDIASPPLRQAIAMLIEAGWEVGLHGSYRAYTNPRQFAAEKQRLESICGRRVSGHRHHYWHLDPHNPEATLLLHEQLGFDYDASLTNDHYLGWRRGSSWPLFPFHQGERRELRTLQLPTGWMDDQLFGQQATNPGDRMALLHNLVDRAETHGGVLLVDVHDYVFDHKLYPGWASTLHDLWEELGQRDTCWMETPGRVAEHWSARYTTILHASLGLMSGSMIRANPDPSAGLSRAAGA